MLKSRGKICEGAELTEDLNRNMCNLNNSDNALVWKGCDTWSYQCSILAPLLLPGQHLLILLLPLFLNPLIVQVQLQQKHMQLRWARVASGNLISKAAVNDALKCLDFYSHSTHSRTSRMLTISKNLFINTSICNLNTYNIGTRPLEMSNKVRVPGVH